MVDVRHSLGSDPNIEVPERESAPGSGTTVHFEARPPKAARCVEPEVKSVVVAESGKNPNVAAETTHVTRPRGVARWLSPSSWVIAFENHWVFIAVGLSLLALFVCAARLRGN